MAFSFRLMFWRWAYRIHRQLHQVDQMATFYNRTATSDAGANWEYDHSV